MLFGASPNAREILQAEALVGELQKLKSIFPPPPPFLYHIGTFSSLPICLSGRGLKLSYSLVLPKICLNLS